MVVQAMLQEDTMVLVTVGWANGGAGHLTRGHDGACDGGMGKWREDMLQEDTMVLVTVR
jgi:hypothetical protein